MAFNTLGALCFPSPLTRYGKPSSPLPFPSSLRFRPCPPRTLIPPSSSAAPSSISPSPSPIFLPHLETSDPESIDDEVVVEEEGGGVLEPIDGEVVEEEQFENEFGELDGSELESEEEDGPEKDNSDPILNFFKSRSETRDPMREGRLTLQRNRRTSWHIADLESDYLEEEEEEVQGVELDSNSGVPEPASEDGAVGEVIMGIARSLPENSTLGEFLDSFAGKVGEGECIELLGRMGEQGFVRESLYLYEWMGLQEPSLVTPRSCSVLFPILGRAGMGDKLMVLFENLPRGKRFRDVCVYNAAISGLSCCGR